VPHCDAETLALLALGDPAVAAADRAHASTCPECASEVAQLADVVRTARDSDVPADLEQPPPQVWGRIADELNLQPRRAHPRRAAAVLVAAAAVVGILVGSGVTWVATRQPAPTVVVAQAQLDPLSAPRASGTAVVRRNAGAQRELVVQVTGLDPTPGTFFEVWLLDKGANRLVSLGVLQAGRTGTFVIPPSLDLSQYPVVDVSLQPLDGNPEHSGDSLVRGTLDS
jgi:anti-sigma-K factor RskA